MRKISRKALPERAVVDDLGGAARRRSALDLVGLDRGITA
jgi:hypothetical protein